MKLRKDKGLNPLTWY